MHCVLRTLNSLFLPSTSKELIRESVKSCSPSLRMAVRTEENYSAMINSHVVTIRMVCRFSSFVLKTLGFLGLAVNI